MKLQIAIAFYLIGFIIFSVTAVFGVKGWDIAYYLSADIGGCGWLLWWVIYDATKRKKMVLPVLIFSILAFLWDCVSYPLGIGWNNPVGTGIGFGLAVLIAIYFIVKGSKVAKYV